MQLSPIRGTIKTKQCFIILSSKKGTQTMSITGVQSSTLVTDIEETPAGVNNFSIVAATVNGSGSQTANNTLLRALFKMGIPVSGKNLFPSNIQGLPTWFHIRLSKDGYIARREKAEILVALNLQTAAEDIKNLPPGGV
jgi:2-oxoglutarate ferredoxin oxidoreductase subunit alpha